MDNLLNFLTSFFGAPAILVALFVLVGNILEKRKFGECLTAMIMAAVGYIGITAGATVIGIGLNGFGRAFQELFGIKGTMPYSDITAANIIAKLNNVASAAALIMLTAMVLNIALARMSRFKYIFLTGHHVLFLGVCYLAFIQAAGWDVRVNIWAFMLLGGLLMSIYMTLSPALSKPYMEFLTQDNKVYIAHANSLGFAIAGWTGNLYGKIKRGKVKRARDIVFPKFLSFFKNSIVSLSLTMIIILNILYNSLWAKIGIAGLVEKEIISSTSMSPIVQAFIDSFTFVVGVEFLIYGVKMMMGELLPSIEGFSKKAIPGVKTGIDCGIVLHYEPTAVIIGFLFSLIGGILGMVASIGFNLLDPILVPAIILPGIVSHFFTGGTAGTFGDIKGGVIGGALGAFLQGIIQTLIPIVFIALAVKYNLLFDANINDPANQNLLWNTMYTESDYAAFILPFGLPMIFWDNSFWMLFVAALVVYIILAVDGLVHEHKTKPPKDKKTTEQKTGSTSAISKTTSKSKVIKINQNSYMPWVMQWIHSATS